MPDPACVTRIGHVTDTEERDIDVIADSGHVRLDVAGAIVFLPVEAAKRLMRHLVDAMAQIQTDEVYAEDPERGGATSAWEHHHG